MKKRIAILAVSLCLLLSGCSFPALDPQNLMTPPRPTGERAQIHDLLTQEAGSNVTLRYPGAGNYRSAILLHNILGDSSEEAMAFYKTPSDANDGSKAISGTNLLFMTEKDGKWELAGKFQNAASQVDRVCFGDLDGDGIDEAIVGWGDSTAGLSNLTVYSGKSGKITEEKLSQTYNELIVQDFDGDGIDELMTISMNPHQPIVASLFRLKDGAMQMMDSIKLDTSVSAITNVITGDISAGQKGVILDGTMSNNMITEILYWDSKDQCLMAPLYEANTMKNSALRSVTVSSQDVDGDGLPEVPFVSLLPAYVGQSSDDVGNLISWQKYDSSKGIFTQAQLMVRNSSDGYSFSLPDSWSKNVTTERTYDRSLTFYELDRQKENSRGDALLTIRAFSQADWDNQNGTQGYTQFQKNGDLVLAVTCPQTQSSLRISVSEALERMKLLDNGS